MEAVAHSPEFAKKVKIPQSVGKEFAEADKGRKFRRGGTTNPKLSSINKQQTHHGKLSMPNASLNKYIGMKEGGTAMKHEDIQMDKKLAKKAVGMHEEQLHGGKKADLSKLKDGGMCCGGKAKKMATGGYVRAADGCAQRGKTKGEMV